MRRLPPTAVRPLRLTAAALLVAGTVLGASGCSLVSSQATEIRYSASDGINVHDSGPLDIRNALVVADAEGTAGNFVAAIVNTTDTEQTLNLSVGEDGARVTVFVPARGVVSLGAGDTEPIALGDIATKPGATLPMYFQSGDGSGVLAPIPVLDASFSYLATLAPTPAPATVAPTTTPTATPTAEPTATPTTAP